MEDAKNVLLVTNSATPEEISLVKESFIKPTKPGLRIKLSLVHVIPNLPTCYFNIPAMAQLTEQYYTEAKECLNSAGQILCVAKRDQWLITGRLKTEVMRLAGKLGSHFILASSTNIQDLYKAVYSSKECKPTVLQNINTLAASNF